MSVGWTEKTGLPSSHGRSGMYLWLQMGMSFGAASTAFFAMANASSRLPGRSPHASNQNRAFSISKQIPS